MGLPICEIYVLHQPHRANESQPGQPPSSEGVLETAIASLELILHNDQTLGQPIGPWKSPSSRIRSTTYQGSAPNPDTYYPIRKSPQIAQLERDHSIDVVILPLPNPSSTVTAGKRRIKLAVFDMDSTLIEQEVIDELAREINKYSEVAEITERAMRGELDFAGSLRERVALLRGLEADIWDTVKGRITFAQGARAFCAELGRRGAKMAVLSGGFTPLAEWVKGELGLSYAHANFLEEERGEDGVVRLSGRLVEGKEIVTAERKRELLLELARENGVRLDEIVCVGDGSNDLVMLAEVGQGGGVAIALKAKPKVQHGAPNKLNSQSMTDILYLLGYNQHEIEELER